MWNSSLIAALEWGLLIARMCLKLRIAEPSQSLVIWGLACCWGLQQSKVLNIVFLPHVERITTLYCLGLGEG